MTTSKPEDPSETGDKTTRTTRTRRKKPEEQVNRVTSPEDLGEQVEGPNLLDKVPGSDGDNLPMFLMPTEEEFDLFGLKEMKTNQAKNLWQVYTSTRNKWFPFELYRIGELVYYEVKLLKLRKKMQKRGGDVWYSGENDMPQESPYQPLIDKMTRRRNKLIQDLGFSRPMMIRETQILGRHKTGHGESIEQRTASDEDEGLIPK